MMACAMARPTKAVQDALRPTGVLTRMRLVGPAESRWRSSIPFSLMAGLDDILVGEYTTSDALLSCFFRKGPEPERSLEDFPHLRADAELAGRLLRGARRRRVAGDTSAAVTRGCCSPGSPRLLRTDEIGSLSRRLGRDLGSRARVDRAGAGW